MQFEMQSSGGNVSSRKLVEKDRSISLKRFVRVSSKMKRPVSGGEELQCVIEEQDHSLIEDEILPLQINNDSINNGLN